MFPNTHSFLTSVGAVGVIVIAFLLVTNPHLVGFEPVASTSGTGMGIPEIKADRVIATPIEVISSTTPEKAVSTYKTPPSKQATNAVKTLKKEARPTPKESVEVRSDSEVVRVQNPYSFPPKTFQTVNEETRSALVNILCGARSGSLRPVSASGVIIDPRGVILTNAHVAQYFLLASDARVDLSCVIRSGSPARPHWTAEVLYMPPIWVKEHANDLNTTRPLGTGEHDYALLRVNGVLAGYQPPTPPAGGFPYLSIDIREAIGFVNDPVLAASYPAEFIGGIATQLDFYPASSVTTIKDLLTFETKSVDVLSIGGVIEAQSGSSGGALVNAWGRLIGIITTTSEGTTTAQRDLRSITLSYINRDLYAQSGIELSTILGGDIVAQASYFNKTEAPALIQFLIDQISHSQN